MAQDDDLRDDTTNQEFNDERVEETLRSNEVDPADVRDSDATELQRDMTDTDADDNM